MIGRETTFSASGLTIVLENAMPQKRKKRTTLLHKRNNHDRRGKKYDALVFLFLMLKESDRVY